MINYHIAWKLSKYGVFSGLYFPVFGLNTKKCGPEKTPYLDNFYAVSGSRLKKDKKNFRNEYNNWIVFSIHFWELVSWQVLERFKTFSNCQMKLCRSLCWKSLVLLFRGIFVLSVGFKMEPLWMNVILW